MPACGISKRCIKGGAGRAAIGGVGRHIRDSLRDHTRTSRCSTGHHPHWSTPSGGRPSARDERTSVPWHEPGLSLGSVPPCRPLTYSSIGLLFDGGLSGTRRRSAAMSRNMGSPSGKPKSFSRPRSSFSKSTTAPNRSWRNGSSPSVPFVAGSFSSSTRNAVRTLCASSARAGPARRSERFFWSTRRSRHEGYTRTQSNRLRASPPR
jgi:hypothetical protein